MTRFDISRLRKEKGMSQNELANLLQMNQSFLSAIENGKSPLPIEKEERLRELFGSENLNAYIIEERRGRNEQDLTAMTDSDLFNQLLSRFHKQAHSEEHEHHHHDHHQKIDDLQKKVDSLFLRIEALMTRNDTLSLENDRLRNEIDSYRKEIEALRKENYELRVGKISQ